MQRAWEPEFLDNPDVPADVARRAYAELARLHRILGDTGAIVSALRREPLPVGRVLEIGCGGGLVLDSIRRKLGVEAVGVDIKPVASCPFPVVAADAARDPLPRADVAFSMHMAHHLDEDALGAMIRNVGLYCRRFVLMDLVRHRLPWVLFRLFVAPFASRVVIDDGLLSVRRAYTPEELRAVVERALADGRSRFVHTVAPFYIRQMVDITYGAAETCESEKR